MNKIKIKLYELDKNNDGFFPEYISFDEEEVVEKMKELNIINQNQDIEDVENELYDAFLNAERKIKNLSIYKFYNQIISRWDYKLSYNLNLDFKFKGVYIYAEEYIIAEELYKHSLINDLYQNYVTKDNKWMFDNCNIERSCEPQYQDELDEIEKV